MEYVKMFQLLYESSIQVSTLTLQFIVIDEVPTQSFKIWVHETRRKRKHFEISKCKKAFFKVEDATL